jgi:predicted nuclease of predicted toxin-antitoxin system
MWLLDHNLPRQLTPILAELGIQCETTRSRGWEQLRNGELVQTASKAGFTTILTRDRGFGDQAQKALKSYPQVAVVLITLPQLRGAAYAEAVRQAWRQNPIRARPGDVVQWPNELPTSVLT